MSFAKWVSLFVFSVLVIPSGFSNDVTVVGTTEHILKESEQEGFYLGKPVQPSTIQLLHVELSPEAKKVLAHRVQQLLTPKEHNYLIPPNLSLPVSVSLGMNHVPVLNQGQHGTCVTFAITGAVDALMAKGDYVSQLCQLQLGGYLQTQGLGYSDWSGGYPIDVITQMTRYGVVNKDKQHSVGCGGYYHYPAFSSHSDSSYMELSQYQEISEPVLNKIITWTEIPASLNSTVDPELKLTAVKQALNVGNRVVFVTLLPDTDLGNTGAVGKHNTWFSKDSWVLTPTILANALQATDAHALIITGYDDNAVAIDTDGEKHQGLLTLRNSWGWWNGYWGEFYMSYDYFKLLAYDVKQFLPMQTN